MPHRRQVLIGLLATVGGARYAHGAISGPLQPTPSQTEGPYHPPPRMRKARFPEDLDHDLSRVGDTLAQGTVLGIHGLVRTVDGAALTGAEVQIWQTCHRGRYLHPQDDFGSEIPPDPGFAYFGSTATDAQGRYAFLTVMPRRYPSGGQREWWRPPHVHIKVRTADKDRLTTQIYFDDPADPENGWKHRTIQSVDRLIGNVDASRRHELVCALRDPREGDLAVLAAFGLPAPDARAGRAPRAGRFDVVVE